MNEAHQNERISEWTNPAAAQRNRRLKITRDLALALSSKFKESTKPKDSFTRATAVHEKAASTSLYLLLPHK